jgi:hypothetical protein
MEAMTMSFPVADPGLLSGLEEGDRISFEFWVDWQGSPPLMIQHLEKLLTAPDDDEESAEPTEKDGENSDAASPHADHGEG